MKLKDTANIISIALVVLFMAPAAGATIVTLNSVEHAGWWEKNLEQPYLKILAESGTVVWSSESSQVNWSSFADLVADLSDDAVGAAGSAPSLGKYEIQSGGNVFSATAAAPIYQTLKFSAGQYTISLDSNSVAYNLQGYSDQYYAGDNLWNAYVQMWVTGGQDLAFGDGSPLYGSEAAALAAYDTMTASLTLFGDADLNFYINDYNSLDNTGSVTLNIQAVPLPAAWLLFGSGMAALVGGRRFRKNRIG